ncbi:MAG TPA: agmatine deiminase family protein [Polyangiales bacterium]
MQANTARAAGYRQPAEWEPHRGCYTAWPAHEFAWGPHLAAAQHEFADFARAFVSDAGQEPLKVLVDDAEEEARARAAIGPLAARITWLQIPCGDVWLRDTAPVFLVGPMGPASVRFRFNGWGEKYIYPHDAELSARLARLHDAPGYLCDLIMEGGALEVDGQGTCLTTRSCLLNPNREAPSPAMVETKVQDALGVSKLIWLDDGLQNDHTDGHIDNIARFVAPGVVVCMQAHDDDDPNRVTFEAIAEQLAAASDARGQALTVVRIPSPGKVLAADGGVVPASYMNFYIGNRTVLVPGFGTRWDAPARAALQELFPDRNVVMCSARALLEGGGTFHCMTQQEPVA